MPYLDFVVSANLLSQIGTGIRNRLEKHPDPAMPQDALPQLIQAHLDGLSGLPCKACIITDTAFEVTDKNGARHQQEDLLHCVSVPKVARGWDWPVVPFGEESRDYQIIHTVVASELT